MKKLSLIILMSVMSLGIYAQKILEFHLEQSRTIEPIQQVLVKPLVADLKMLKKEMVTYPVSWQLQGTKIGEIKEIELENAIKSAIHQAAVSDGADVIVASTYEVRNHLEYDKKGNGVMSEMGIDIIVRGYPAKYENFRPFDEKQDLNWSNVLINAQSVYGDYQKTKAVTSK